MVVKTEMFGTLTMKVSGIDAASAVKMSVCSDHV